VQITRLSLRETLGREELALRAADVLRKNDTGAGLRPIQIPKLHRTPELRFRALVTEGGAERVELAKT
jgi:hypothetical protein